MNAKKFTAERTPTGGFLEKDWDDYWKSLTEEQKQTLRDKSAWEHMSLMAVAREWGA